MSRSDSNNLLSPSTHSMNLRVPKNMQGDTPGREREAENNHLIGLGWRDPKEPQEVVNMGLEQLRAARGTATRKLRTVKKAWGSFKAKMRPALMPQPSYRSHQPWSMSMNSPQTPSTRRLMINSPLPLTPGHPYATPTRDNHTQYRPAAVGTPLTPLTPLALDGVRRSARIASRTPTPRRDVTSGRRPTRRATPKRIHLAASPGQVLRDLNSLTLQVAGQGQGSPAGSVKTNGESALDTLRSMGASFSKTIVKQDSSGKLTEIPVQKNKKVAPVKPKRKKVAAAPVAKDSQDTKENDELEPRRRIRLRNNDRGVVVSQKQWDGQMLTANFAVFEEHI